MRRGIKEPLRENEEEHYFRDTDALLEDTTREIWVSTEDMTNDKITSIIKHYTSRHTGKTHVCLLYY